MNKGKEGEKDGQKNMKMEKQEDLKKKKSGGLGGIREDHVSYLLRSHWNGGRRARIIICSFTLSTNIA
jgi:hypothetical protein